jgi:hypothetical protein
MGTGPDDGMKTRVRLSIILTRIRKQNIRGDSHLGYAGHYERVVPG